MLQETLVETYKHNLQTAILIKMGVVGTQSWIDLVKQGQQVEDIIRQIDESRSQRWTSSNRQQLPPTRSKGKEVMILSSLPIKNTRITGTLLDTNERTTSKMNK